MNLILLLLFLALIITAAIAISALYRADMARNETAELRNAMYGHAAKVWEAIEELRKRE